MAVAYYICQQQLTTVTKGVKTRRFSFSIRTAMISFFTLCGMLKRGQSLLKREHYPADFKIFFGLPCLYFSGGVYQLKNQIRGNKTKGALPQGHTIHCLISSNNIAFNLSSFFFRCITRGQSTELSSSGFVTTIVLTSFPAAEALLGRRLSAKDKALTILMPWSFHSM